MKDRLQTPIDRSVVTALARVDPVALGAALGVVGGLAVFLATVMLLLKDAPHGPNLALLAQYFIGYSVTPKGSVIGFVNGAAYGFVLGWFIGALRNVIVRVYLRVIGVRAALAEVSRTLGPD